MSLWNSTAWGQQTAASQMLAAKAGRRGGLKSAAKRRGKKKSASRVRVRRRKTASGTATRRRRSRSRLVKGSPAARRHMARLRRMRKK